MNEKCKKWENEIVTSIAEKGSEGWLDICSVQCSWDILDALGSIENEISAARFAHQQAVDKAVELLKRDIIDYLEPIGVGRAWHREADIVKHVASTNNVEAYIVHNVMTRLECDGKIERDCLDIPHNWMGERIYRLVNHRDKRTLMAVTED